MDWSYVKIILVSDISVWHVSFIFLNSFPSHFFQNSGWNGTDSWLDLPLLIIVVNFVFRVISSLFLNFHVTVTDWIVDIFQMIGYFIRHLMLLPLLTALWCCLFLQTRLRWRSRGGIILSFLIENSLPIFRLSQTVPYVYHPAVAILSVMLCKLV
jgi:hypothetical protein